MPSTSPTKPNDDLYNDGETISTIINKLLLPQLPFVTRIPFVETAQRFILANTETYTADTDPLNEVPPESDDWAGLGGWPEVNVTLGSTVSLNTKMRRTKCSFTIEDLEDPRFNSIVQKTYGRMAWLIAKQINASISAAIIAGATAQTTYQTAKHVGVWSGVSDPLLDIRSMAQDISVNVGYTLDTVIVNQENYYEMLDYLNESDEDKNFARSQFPPQMGFYETITYITNPGCWVIGVPTGTGVAEGVLIGIGKFMGGPCVEAFVYRDPNFTYAPLPVDNTDTNPGPIAAQALANLPLNINPWDAPDHRTHNVEAWINTAVHVGAPYGVFYKAGAI